MIREYKKLKGIWGRLKKIWFWVLVAFVGIFALSILMYGSFSEEAEQLVKAYRENYDGILGTTGVGLCFGILKNNLFASATTVVLGSIPFLFIPALLTMSNSWVSGMIVGYTGATTGALPIKLVALGILPHGIFEITALTISIALGIYLCKEITSKILGKKNKGPMLGVLNDIARTFVLVVIPLLILAAIIETFVSPALLSLAI